MNTVMNGLTIAAGVVIVLFTALLGGTILYKIWMGKVNLHRLLSEPNGDASLSRLQFLIFTFVIGLSFFLVTVGHKDSPQFPSPFPVEVLTLLGISGSSFLVSKGIQFSNPAGVARPALLISPASVVQTPGAPIPNFTVSVVNVPGGTPLPALTWSLDAPAFGAINPIPPNQAEYKPPAASPGAGTVVTIRAKAAGFE